MGRPQAADDELPTGATIRELFGVTPTLVGLAFAIFGIDRLVWVQSAERTGNQRLAITGIMIAAILIGVGLVIADVLRRRKRAYLIPTSTGVVLHERGARVVKFGPELIEREDNTMLKVRAGLLAIACIIALATTLRDVDHLGWREITACVLAFALAVVVAGFAAFSTVISVPAGQRRRKLRIWRTSREQLS